MKKTVATKGAAEANNGKTNEAVDWRGKMLTRLRQLINEAARRSPKSANG